MSHYHHWTGYPFLPAPALFLQQFRCGNLAHMRMLFFHFYPALCFFAQRLTADATAAELVAAQSLEALWHQRQSISHLQEIKNFLYIRTYQQCNQFTHPPTKMAGNGQLSGEEEALQAIIAAEIFSSIEEMPDAAGWLQSRLLLLPPPATE